MQIVISIYADCDALKYLTLLELLRESLSSAGQEIVFSSCLLVSCHPGDHNSSGRLRKQFTAADVLAVSVQVTVRCAP